MGNGVDLNSRMAFNWMGIFNMSISKTVVRHLVFLNCDTRKRWDILFIQWIVLRRSWNYWTSFDGNTRTTQGLQKTLLVKDHQRRKISTRWKHLSYQFWRKAQKRKAGLLQILLLYPSDSRMIIIFERSSSWSPLMTQRIPYQENILEHKSIQ